MLLVILGAGASYDSWASSPLDASVHGNDLFANSRPPLTKDLFAEQLDAVTETTREIPELAPWVSYVRHKLAGPAAATDSVEGLLARIDREAEINPLMQIGSLAIRLFLCYMLSSSQDKWLRFVTASSTNYGTLLVEILAARISSCFVDFNYDTMLEQALPAVGVGPDFVLIKPHGAINWFRDVAGWGGRLS